MSKLKVLIALVVAVGALALIVGSPALAATPTTHAVYSFDLTSGNTATAPVASMMAAPGDSIRVKGSGTFDPIARTVRASGKFVHYAADGSVHCQGTWKATGFTSFVDFGVNSDGQEGGFLSLVVSHSCTTMGMTMSGIRMTVISTVKAPAGYLAGITVGDFTVPTGGTVVMQPQQ
jgi:hypothetical protein